MAMDSNPQKNDVIPTNLGSRLPALLYRWQVAQGLTTRAMSDRLGMSPAVASTWQTGRNHPLVRTWPTLAKTLGVPLESLSTILRAEQLHRAGTITRDECIEYTAEAFGVCMEAIAAGSRGAHTPVHTGEVRA
jgi:transcriptional regulator with XRE-family HTH domain